MSGDGQETDFSDVEATNGYYLWSDPKNWTNGVPTNGSIVVATGQGDEDIPDLELSELTVSGETDVTQYSLIVDSLATSGVGNLIAAADQAGHAVEIDATDITTPGYYDAFGFFSPAKFVDNSLVDNGAFYGVVGYVEIANAVPNPGNEFNFEGPGAVVLPHAQTGTNESGFLANIQGGDSVELPAGSVSGIIYGGGPTGQLQIQTDVGTFTFGASFGYPYANVLNGYTVAPATDGTSLVAITFNPIDDFQQKETVNPYASDYYWNNPANWTNGEVPGDNEQYVSTSEDGFNDIPSLSVAYFNNSATTYAIGNDFTIGYLDGTGQLSAPVPWLPMHSMPDRRWLSPSTTRGDWPDAVGRRLRGGHH